MHITCHLRPYLFIILIVVSHVVHDPQSNLFCLSDHTVHPVKVDWWDDMQHVVAVLGVLCNLREIITDPARSKVEAIRQDWRPHLTVLDQESAVQVVQLGHAAVIRGRKAE